MIILLIYTYIISLSPMSQIDILKEERIDTQGKLYQLTEFLKFHYQTQQQDKSITETQVHFLKKEEKRLLENIKEVETSWDHMFFKKVQTRVDRLEKLLQEEQIPWNIEEEPSNPILIKKKLECNDSTQSIFYKTQESEYPFFSFTQYSPQEKSLTPSTLPLSQCQDPFNLQEEPLIFSQCSNREETSNEYLLTQNISQEKSLTQYSLNNSSEKGDFNSLPFSLSQDLSDDDEDNEDDETSPFIISQNQYLLYLKRKKQTQQPSSYFSQIKEKLNSFQEIKEFNQLLNHLSEEQKEICIFHFYTIKTIPQKTIETVKKSLHNLKERFEIVQKKMQDQQNLIDKKNDEYTHLLKKTLEGTQVDHLEKELIKEEKNLEKLDKIWKKEQSSMLSEMIKSLKLNDFKKEQSKKLKDILFLLKSCQIQSISQEQLTSLEKTLDWIENKINLMNIYNQVTLFPPPIQKFPLTIVFKATTCPSSNPLPEIIPSSPLYPYSESIKEWTQTATQKQGSLENPTNPLVFYSSENKRQELSQQLLEEVSKTKKELKCVPFIFQNLPMYTLIENIIKTEEELYKQTIVLELSHKEIWKVKNIIKHIKEQLQQQDKVEHLPTYFVNCNDISGRFLDFSLSPQTSSNLLIQPSFTFNYLRILREFLTQLPYHRQYSQYEKEQQHFLSIQQQMLQSISCLPSIFPEHLLPNALIILLSPEHLSSGFHPILAGFILERILPHYIHQQDIKHLQKLPYYGDDTSNYKNFYTTMKLFYTHILYSRCSLINHSEEKKGKVEFPETPSYHIDEKKEDHLNPLSGSPHELWEWVEHIFIPICLSELKLNEKNPIISQLRYFIFQNCFLHLYNQFNHHKRHSWISITQNIAHSIKNTPILTVNIPQSEEDRIKQETKLLTPTLSSPKDVYNISSFLLFALQSGYQIVPLLNCYLFEVKKGNQPPFYIQQTPPNKTFPYHLIALQLEPSPPLQSSFLECAKIIECTILNFQEKEPFDVFQLLIKSDNHKKEMLYRPLFIKKIIEETINKLKQNKALLIQQLQHLESPLEHPKVTSFILKKLQDQFQKKIENEYKEMQSFSLKIIDQYHSILNKTHPFIGKQITHSEKKKQILSEFIHFHIINYFKKNTIQKLDEECQEKVLDYLKNSCCYLATNQEHILHNLFLLNEKLDSEIDLFPSCIALPPSRKWIIKELLSNWKKGVYQLTQNYKKAYTLIEFARKLEVSEHIQSRVFSCKNDEKLINILKTYIKKEHFETQSIILSIDSNMLEKTLWLALVQQINNNLPLPLQNLLIPLNRLLHFIYVKSHSKEAQYQLYTRAYEIILKGFIKPLKTTFNEKNKKYQTYAPHKKFKPHLYLLLDIVDFFVYLNKESCEPSMDPQTKLPNRRYQTFIQDKALVDPWMHNKVPFFFFYEYLNLTYENWQQKEKSLDRFLSQVLLNLPYCQLNIKASSSKNPSPETKTPLFFSQTDFSQLHVIQFLQAQPHSLPSEQENIKKVFEIASKQKALLLPPYNISRNTLITILIQLAQNNLLDEVFKEPYNDIQESLIDLLLFYDQIQQTKKQVLLLSSDKEYQMIFKESIDDQEAFTKESVYHIPLSIPFTLIIPASTVNTTTLERKTLTYTDNQSVIEFSYFVENIKFSEKKVCYEKESLLIEKIKEILPKPFIHNEDCTQELIFICSNSSILNHIFPEIIKQLQFFSQLQHPPIYLHLLISLPKKAQIFSSQTEVLYFLSLIQKFNYPSNIFIQQYLQVMTKFSPQNTSYTTEEIWLLNQLINQINLNEADTTYILKLLKSLMNIKEKINKSYFSKIILHLIESNQIKKVWSLMKNSKNDITFIIKITTLNQLKDNESQIFFCTLIEIYYDSFKLEGLKYFINDILKTDLLKNNLGEHYAYTAELFISIINFVADKLVPKKVMTNEEGIQFIHDISCHFEQKIKNDGLDMLISRLLKNESLKGYNLLENLQQFKRIIKKTKQLNIDIDKKIIENYSSFLRTSIGVHYKNNNFQPEVFNELKDLYQNTTYPKIFTNELLYTILSYIQHQSPTSHEKKVNFLIEFIQIFKINIEEKDNTMFILAIKKYLNNNSFNDKHINDLGLFNFFKKKLEQSQVLSLRQKEILALIFILSKIEPQKNNYNIELFNTEMMENVHNFIIRTTYFEPPSLENPFSFINMCSELCKQITSSILPFYIFVQTTIEFFIKSGTVSNEVYLLQILLLNLYKLTPQKIDVMVGLCKELETSMIQFYDSQNEKILQQRNLLAYFFLCNIIGQNTYNPYLYPFFPLNFYFNPQKDGIALLLFKYLVIQSPHLPISAKLTQYLSSSEVKNFINLCLTSSQTTQTELEDISVMTWIEGEALGQVLSLCSSFAGIFTTSDGRSLPYSFLFNVLELSRTYLKYEHSSQKSIKKVMSLEKEQELTHKKCLQTTSQRYCQNHLPFLMRKLIYGKLSLKTEEYSDFKILCQNITLFSHTPLAIQHLTFYISIFPFHQIGLNHIQIHDLISLLRILLTDQPLSAEELQFMCNANSNNKVTYKELKDPYFDKKNKSLKEILQHPHIRNKTFHNTLLNKKNGTTQITKTLEKKDNDTFRMIEKSEDEDEDEEILKEIIFESFSEEDILNKTRSLTDPYDLSLNNIYYFLESLRNLFISNIDYKNTNTQLFDNSLLGQNIFLINIFILSSHLKEEDFEEFKSITLTIAKKIEYFEKNKGLLSSVRKLYMEIKEKNPQVINFFRLYNRNFEKFDELFSHSTPFSNELYLKFNRKIQSHNTHFIQEIKTGSFPLSLPYIHHFSHLFNQPNQPTEKKVTLLTQLFSQEIDTISPEDEIVIVHLLSLLQNFNINNLCEMIPDQITVKNFYALLILYRPYKKINLTDKEKIIKKLMKKTPISQESLICFEILKQFESINHIGNKVFMSNIGFLINEDIPIENLRHGLNLELVNNKLPFQSQMDILQRLIELSNEDYICSAIQLLAQFDVSPTNLILSYLEEKNKHPKLEDLIPKDNLEEKILFLIKHQKLNLQELESLEKVAQKINTPSINKDISNHIKKMSRNNLCKTSQLIEKNSGLYQKRA